MYFWDTIQNGEVSGNLMIELFFSSLESKFGGLHMLSIVAETFNYMYVEL